MKTNVKNLPESRVQLTVEVQENELGPEISNAYKRVAKKYSIPGFRKGSIPQKIIDVKIGKDIVLNEMLKEAVPIFYIKAIEESNIYPISKPNIEIVSLSEKELVFNADVIIKPKIQLCDYKNIEITVPKEEVTDEEINERLMILRERFSKLEPVKRKVKDSDFVLVDHDVYHENKKRKELSISDYMLEVDKQKLIEPLYKSIVGANLNDVKETTVTFPDEHQNKELAGKDVNVILKIKEIKEKILPEADDIFAQESSQFETIKELKKDIRKNIASQKDEMRKVRISEKALEEVVEQSKVDAPKEIIEEETNRLFHNFENSLRQSNLNLEEYLKASKTSIEEIKENMKSEAERSLTTEFILDNIVEKEELQAEQKDIDKEIRKYAEAAQQPVEIYRKQLEQTNKIYSIIRDIKYRKALKIIVDNIKVKDEIDAKKGE